MKKLRILLLAFVATISLNSCSDDEGFTFIAQEDPEGIAFINSTSETYVLTANNAQNLGERFVWNAVDFDVPTTVRYELQGSGDPDFANYDLIASDISETNYAVTVGQMISIAEDAGLDNDPATDAPNTGTIYFRVVAYAGTNTNNNVIQTSDPIAINVELVEPTGGEEPEVPLDLFLVGSATPTGWDNTPTSNNYPLFRDAENESLYHYTGKFAGGEDAAFKLIEEKGLWAPQYGGENGTLIYRPTEAEPDPAAIAIAEEGYYTLTVDIDEMTYTLTPYDASGDETFETIGVIGSATTGNDDGWAQDIDMTQSTFDPHIWFIQGIELFEVDGEVGKIKFRADDAWDVNWGGPTSPSGIATPGGADIDAPEGTYDIWFNDITLRYILIPVE